MSEKVKSDLYKAAGVDIDLATSLLDQVKKKFAEARRPEMLAPVGGFAVSSSSISRSTKSRFWSPASTVSVRSS